MKRVLTVLRMLAGVAICLAAAIWALVQREHINFVVPLVLILVGLIVIDAPRILKAHKEGAVADKQYLATHPQDDREWRRIGGRSWYIQIALFALFVLAAVAAAIFFPGNMFAFIPAGIVLLVGFFVRMRDIVVQSDIRFRMAAARPGASPNAHKFGWVMVVVILIATVAATIAERVWGVDAMSWVLGAILVAGIVGFAIRKMRGQ